LVFNWFPAFRGTGARVTYIARDWREIHVTLPLSWRTRNYVGTIYGGSMYSAVDPMYMIMLIRILGEEYVVWDKAASIRFRRPGRSRLFATFQLTDQEIDEIRALLDSATKTDRTYTIDLVDRQGEVYASVDKVIHIRRRETP
jgi:acyl-coenzyme A thioesterase PaaI-like protein